MIYPIRKRRERKGYFGRRASDPENERILSKTKISSETKGSHVTIVDMVTILKHGHTAIQTMAETNKL